MVPQKAESSHHAHLTAARAWLEHFPDNRRSPIANWHHHAVRTGAHTPETVIQQVHQEAQRRLQWTSHPAERVHLQTVLEALQSDRTGALAYAASIIVYE